MNSLRILILIAFGLAVSDAAVAGGDPIAGKQKAEVCAACHGEDGNSPNPAYPKLAGQYASYLAKALADYKSGARQNAIMAGFATPLSKADIQDLAAYFSGQSGDLFAFDAD